LLFPSLFPFLLTSGESPTSTYDEIKAYGESTLDEWTFQNIDIPEADLWTYGQSATPTWQYNTILLMPFSNNFDAGNFPTNNNPVTAWYILRRETGSVQFEQIASIPNDNKNVYYDTTAISGVSYEYAVQASSYGTKGDGIISGGIMTNFFGWRLQSIDYNETTNTGTSYSFILMNESGSISPTQARTVHNTTYASKPTIEYGAMQYLSGNLKTMPYSDDCTNEIASMAQYNLLYAFITDKTTKILKNGSGLTMYVDTFNPQLKYIDEITNNQATNPYEQPYYFTFDYVQIA